MSGPDREPSVPSLEHLRKHAKRLLRRARSGDRELLKQLREQLPRLASLTDERVAAEIQLADIQHALAREHGLESWTALKHHIEAQQPLAALVAQFLAAVRDDHAEDARGLLERHPAIAGHDPYTAAAACDADALAQRLAREPALATAPDSAAQWTPLDYLCQSSVHAIDAAHAASAARCAALLLDHGADPNTATLWNASDPSSKLSVLYRACEQDNPGVVKLLLERGADPNDGESVYHSAEKNRRTCLELLFEHGADLGGRHAHWGNTPLYFLSGYHDGHPLSGTAMEGMRWLLEHGADPNVTSTKTEETPLHRVAELGRGAAVVELLLSHGADPGATRADGLAPYALAVRAGNSEVAELLRTHGAAPNVTPLDRLIGACMRADRAAVRLLLEEHPGLAAKMTEHDRGIIAAAAGHGKFESVRLLIEAGFDLDAEMPWGGPPLHHAAWHGNLALLELLLEHGAKVNVRDKEYGSSPLGWAAHGSGNCREADDEYRTVVEALIAAGADLATATNRWNEAPDALASDRIAALLRERGYTRGA